MALEPTRPAFFEGQFLGAADLTAAVEYGRGQAARHNLAAHTWGIAVGLQLSEQPAGADPNQIDVFVQPGYAVDGFGRVLLVSALERIAPDLFKDIVYDPALDDPALSGADAAGRRVPVWLRYVETATQPPRPGFQQCETDDQFARIQEGFRIVVGERSEAAQRDRLTVAGRQIDARDALTAFDPAAATLYDTSVPHQTLPETGSRALWYVPLGVVRWLPNQVIGQPGQFVARTAADLADSRQRRRYIGVVAESLAAADGILRLRNRGADYSQVQSNDLVWVEGSLRVQGDARLFGGKAAWLNTAGSDGGVPLEIRRDPTGLRVAIGQDTAGVNRFGVGPLQAGAPGTPATVAEKFVVRDDGRVGIGTTTPALTLDIQGDFGRQNAAATLSLFGSRIGDVGNGILFVRSGGGVVAFDGGDNVGIGSTTPNRPLAVRGTGPGQELVSFEDPAGATKWHINQNVQNRPGFNIAETGIEDGRLFIAAGGNVGIGTTQPAQRLDIQGDFGRQNGPATLSLFGSRIGDIGGGVLFVRSGGAVVAFDGGDNVGVGTAIPLTRLHVSGSQSAPASSLNAHIALVENTDASSDADVLALRVVNNLPGASNNFVTFFSGAGAIGAIEGDSALGVSYTSGGADFAECLPRARPDETLAPGDIVGIVGGQATRATAGAHHVRVVSERPIVLGAAPPDRDRTALCPVAFLGQVAVRVRGPVRAGDLIVPSGEGDGVGVAVTPDALAPEQAGQVVGTAWESSAEASEKRINTAIGLASVAPAGLLALWRAQQAEVAALRAEVAALRATSQEA